MLVHGGGIRGFMSGLALWPERQVGLFVSNNGYSDRLVRDLVASFAARFLPKYVRPRAAGVEGLPLSRYAGAYRALSATSGTIEKAGALRNGDLEIDTTFWNRLAIGRSRFIPLGNGAFVENWSGERLWVVERPGRSVLAVTTDPVNGVVGFERVPWYSTARCHREVLFVCCLVFVSVLLPWHRAAASREGSRHPSPAVRGARGARLLLASVAVANLLALVLVVAAFRGTQGAGMLFGLPVLVSWAQRLAAAAGVAGLLLVAGLWPVWRAEGWSPRARLCFTAGVAACVVFTAWAWHWHLV